MSCLLVFSCFMFLSSLWFSHVSVTVFLSISPALPSALIHITCAFMFMPLADAFIQSDLQVGRQGKGVFPEDPYWK